MNLLKDNVKKLYRKFLVSAMGSAVVMSIYSFVDTIAVGQSEGPVGVAAMAVITPFYGILVFLSILCGIGGSVVMSEIIGEGNKKKGKELFTVSTLVMSTIIIVFWILFACFAEKIFTIFGATESLMPTVIEYAEWIVWFFPMFLLPTFLGAFLRNDNAPTLAMVAVIVGGCVNVFGDWFLVFPLGMGMKGAAIATVVGTTTQVFIMLSHFFTKKNNLQFVKPTQFWKDTFTILKTGFSAGILDLGTVVTTCLMNNQIMKYGNKNALAVYGVIATVTSLFQALYCGVGQAVQPLVSTNYGAGQIGRIKSFFKLSIITVFIMGIVFTLVGNLFPIPMTKLFMATTPEVLEIAPKMIRFYFILFLFLGVNVFAVYYLQALLNIKISLIIAVLRSIVISTISIYIMPLIFDFNGVLLALPISEIVVAIISIIYFLHINKENNEIV